MMRSSRPRITRKPRRAMAAERRRPTAPRAARWLIVSLRRPKGLDAGSCPTLRSTISVSCAREELRRDAVTCYQRARAWILDDAVTGAADNRRRAQRRDRTDAYRERLRHGRVLVSVEVGPDQLARWNAWPCWTPAIVTRLASLRPWPGSSTPRPTSRRWAMRYGHPNRTRAMVRDAVRLSSGRK